MKRRCISLLLALLCLTGCGGTEAGAPPPAPSLTEESASALSDFSLNLLRETWTGEDSVLISPLSALFALGMTANGAGGETLAQMESVLPLPELNGALAACRQGLSSEKSCRIELANSLWLRDDGSFQANPDFLRAASDWYQAEVFPSPFDDGTLRDLNGWVRKNTRGMIPEILDEIPDDAVLYLVNALALEAEWAEIYQEHQSAPGFFFPKEGTEQPAEFLHSLEGLYLQDEGAQGFLKPYQGGRWAFGALLPEGDLEDYLSTLTGARLYELLTRPEERSVSVSIPKFQCEYGTDLSDSLKAMGITDAFDPGRADLSGLGFSQGPLYISRVLHRTRIAVDERGTKAGAATAVETKCGGTGPGGEIPQVCLDRPFLYFLVDRETGLPAFLGVVTKML